MIRGSGDSRNMCFCQDDQASMCTRHMCNTNGLTKPDLYNDSTVPSHCTAQQICRNCFMLMPTQWVQQTVPCATKRRDIAKENNSKPTCVLKWDSSTNQFEARLGNMIQTKQSCPHVFQQFWINDMANLGVDIVWDHEVQPAPCSIDALGSRDATVARLVPRELLRKLHVCMADRLQRQLASVMPVDN